MIFVGLFICWYTVSVTVKRKKTEQQVIDLCPAFVKIDYSTYSGRNVKARFIDEDYGEFWAKPGVVWHHQSGHPERTKQRRRETNLKKYGTAVASKSDQVRSRASLTWKRKKGLTEAEISERLRGTKIRIDYETYQSSQIPAKFIHEDLGEWFQRPSDVFRFKRHPEESKKRHKDSYLKKVTPVEEIQKQLPEGIKLDPSSYVSTHKKARFIDPEYGEWWATPNNVISKKQGHPVGRMKKIQETNLSKYGHKTFLNTDESRAALIRSPNRFCSSGEQEVLSWVSSLGLKAKKGFCWLNKRPFEMDIMIPSAKFCIEYHGENWHHDKIVGKKYHHEKMLAANQNGFRLVQIFENEWKHKKDQVQSFLLSALGLNEKTVGARKCLVRQIEKKQAKEFLESFHIQGAGQIETALALFHEEKIIAVASFVRHHRNRKDWVLSRWCCAKNCTIQGGLSKIMKAFFESDPTIKKVISWSDNRWSNGNGYLKSGWELDGELPPDYFYYGTKGEHRGRIVSKQSRKKSVVKTPSGMTEHQHSMNDGLLRIYDAGKKRWVIKSPI
jgi:hypothetical protein